MPDWLLKCLSGHAVKGDTPSRLLYGRPAGSPVQPAGAPRTRAMLRFRFVVRGADSFCTTSTSEAAPTAPSATSCCAARRGLPGPHH
ncbi:MAG: hypothetical protein HY784_17205 [Chloroflexi bacterium]|nr:hypothetical protein [Chloroflexota bacterium]